jgi:hypothetical protein
LRQRRLAQTLARILAECRKFHLHLGLAHQTLSQIGSDLLKGALENAGIKAVFGIGRETAQALVEELFIPELSQGKHEVENENSRERTHPTFFSLGEQWERYTQLAQRLPRRPALIQLPEQERVRRIRTLTVAERGISEAALEVLRGELACASGRPRADLEAALARRQSAQTALAKELTVRYYEDTDPS